MALPLMVCGWPLRLIWGFEEDASVSVFWMVKEVTLMTDFELLSLVISIISLVIIVLKK